MCGIVLGVLGDAGERSVFVDAESYTGLADGERCFDGVLVDRAIEVLGVSESIVFLHVDVMLDAIPVGFRSLLWFVGGAVDFHLDRTLGTQSHHVIVVSVGELV